MAKSRNRTAATRAGCVKRLIEAGASLPNGIKNASWESTSLGSMTLLTFQHNSLLVMLDQQNQKYGTFYCVDVQPLDKACRMPPGPGLGFSFYTLGQEVDLASPDGHPDAMQRIYHRLVPLDRIDFNAMPAKDVRKLGIYLQISEQPQLSPVALVPADRGRFRVVDGHKRCNVFRLLGRPFIRAEIHATLKF